MVPYRLANEKILLFGLHETLAAELAGTLAFEGLAFAVEPLSPAADRMKAAVQSEVSMVFCSADRESCEMLLNFLRQEKLELPVVVVSRLPTTDEWLDAIELGAADYCSPPFEPLQISWIVDNALKLRRPLAA